MGRFKELGAQPIGSTPAEFDALIGRELSVWADVVRRSGVKAN
jgi:tripartite-type tricarboxylate transporter receptor subunit TctC